MIKLFRYGLDILMYLSFDTWEETQGDSGYYSRNTSSSKERKGKKLSDANNNYKKQEGSWQDKWGIEVSVSHSIKVMGMNNRRNSKENSWGQESIWFPWRRFRTVSLLFLIQMSRDGNKKKVQFNSSQKHKKTPFFKSSERESSGKNNDYWSQLDYTAILFCGRFKETYQSHGKRRKIKLKKKRRP